VAVLRQKFLCFHGDLSPEFKKIDQIRSINKPIQNAEDNPLVCSLVWSDPSDGLDHFMKNRKGKGYLF
jgi:diadenosine tetraphosphatase ApaH/serine/threonine PP2A family protein phosphatase